VEGSEEASCKVGPGAGPGRGRELCRLLAPRVIRRCRLRCCCAGLSCLGAGPVAPSRAARCCKRICSSPLWPPSSSCESASQQPSRSWSSAPHHQEPVLLLSRHGSSFNLLLPSLPPLSYPLETSSSHPEGRRNPPTRQLIACYVDDSRDPVMLQSSRSLVSSVRTCQFR
jgi:hypothetical protein